MNAGTLFSKPVFSFLRLGRLIVFVLACILLTFSGAQAQPDPLPSWNDTAAKKAIIAFVQTTTDKSNPNYVAPEARIATFDQDGTTWVEQPMYPTMLYCLERVRVLAKEKPELAGVEPFKSVLAEGPKALADISLKDLETLYAATLTGMSVDEFNREVNAWLETTKDPRFGRRYTELVYQPMLEVMQYLRANGYKTYFVTGGGQDFVRAYAERVYGIPPEQVVGTMDAVKFGYDAAGKPVLTKEPKLLLNDVEEGKPEGIHLLIGRRPYAAFGNSTGDKQMLEYTQAGEGMRLMVLVHHDDDKREYAYDAQSKIGTFSDALMNEAKQKGWLVISMKNDWKRIFPWEQ
jgi:phosphoserine phosphatase